jgi:hypothetical protein
VVAISRPRFGKSSLNNCAAMPLSTEFGVSCDIIKVAVPASVAQDVWSGDKHAMRASMRDSRQNAEGLESGAWFFT